jgi:hypothetical protein
MEVFRVREFRDLSSRDSKTQVIGMQEILKGSPQTKVLANNANDVCIWVREAREGDFIRHGLKNQLHLSEQ